MGDYTLSSSEDYLYREFELGHKEQCDSDVELIFTETCIGVKIEVYCPIRGERKNITDYNVW